MEFRALGRLAVIRDGEEVDIGGQKPRSIVAFLLLHRNTVVATDRILDALWGEDGSGKVNALRVHVSRIRDALDPDRSRGEDSILRTVENGYQLDVDDEQYDVAKFEALAAAGRADLSAYPERAGEVLRGALDLWTGDAFADFEYDDFAHHERRRLSDLRADVVEDRIEAELALGMDGELVSELEVLRQQHPLRERLVAHHALALYRSGRPADGLRAIDRFRRQIGEELGIDPSPRLLRLEEQMLLHDERIQPDLPDGDQLVGPGRAATNPFKGLRAFGVDDAGMFFGRDALVAELLRTIGRGQRLVTLIGASGSGKSSVVRAGLIPALAKGAIDGSDEWLVANMVPGAHPFAELEAALIRSTLDAPPSLVDQLDDGDAGVMRAALRILPTDEAHLVIVIDQFEELFTLVEDESVVERFLANIVTAVDDPHGRISVIVTLRADFYGMPLAHPAFGARLGSGVVNVTPMTAEELEAAALRPAAEQGVSFEAGLARPTHRRCRQSSGSVAAVPVRAHRVVRPADGRHAHGRVISRHGRTRRCAAASGDRPLRAISTPSVSEAAAPALPPAHRGERRRPTDAAPGTGPRDRHDRRRHHGDAGRHRSLQRASAAVVRRRSVDRRADGRGRPRGDPHRVAAARRVDRGEP